MKNSLTLKAGTLVGAFLILVALYGSFLFDTDGAALGLALFGISAESALVAIFGVVGDLIWIIGGAAGVLAAVAISGIFNEEKLRNLAIAQYLVARRTDKPVDKIYARPSWSMPVSYTNGAMALLGMGSGFWFTGTLWLVSLIATQVQHSKLQKVVQELDELAYHKGIVAVEKLADPVMLTALDALETK